jgi:hypothetical protein
MPRRRDDLSDVEAPKAALPHKKRPNVRRPAPRSRSVSAIIGAILLVVAVASFAWLVTRHYQPAGLPILSLPGFAPTNTPIVQTPPLLAAGITLGDPKQPPALNQQQALFIASQLEPDAAAKAQTTNARYVLLNYDSKGTPAARPDLNNTPAWMVLYQNIPLEPSDASVDPTPFPQSHHDLYVFLDATTGKELLVIWV